MTQTESGHSKLNVSHSKMVENSYVEQQTLKLPREANMLSSAKKAAVFDYGGSLQVPTNDVKLLNMSSFSNKLIDEETDSKTSEASGNISAQIKEAQAKSTFFDTAIFDQ